MSEALYRMSKRWYKPSDHYEMRFWQLKVPCIGMAKCLGPLPAGRSCSCHWKAQQAVEVRHQGKEARSNGDFFL